MELMRRDKKAKEQADALRFIRTRLHKIEHQEPFARLIGASKKQYGNWENGYRIPEDKARKIKQITPGIDADFILWAEEDGLRADLLKLWRASPKSQQN